jgi:hypothetical protein
MVTANHRSQSGRTAGHSGRKLRIAVSLALFIITRITPSSAQNLVGGAPAAASGQAFDVGVGYSYLSMQIPGAGRVNLDGLNAAGRVDFSDHWAATIDSSYVRSSDVLATGHVGYLLSLMAGPELHLRERTNTRLFIRAMGGVGMVDGVAPLNSANYLHGFVVRPSYAAGGGVERVVGRHFAVRITADYLRTAFANSAEAIAGQNNLRLSASFVVRLKDRRY